MDSTIHSDLIRGHIDTIILKALYDGDRYGFDIIKEIEQKSSGQYILKQPTLYSCLKRLEVQGFIKSYWGSKSNGGRRKYYTLTDMGKDLFIKNQSEWVYSRTVIDKLISDRDFDFSAAALTVDDEYSDSDSEEAFDDTENEDEENENDATEENEGEEELADIIDGDELDEQENEESDRKDAYAAEQRAQTSDHPYIDTTAIMNEMLEQRSDGSYTEKVKNEQYVPSETIDPNSYFDDNYYDDEPVARAVPDDEPYYETSERSAVNNPAPSYASTAAYESEPPQSEEAKTRPEFYSYDSTVSQTDENAIIINREYKNILCELRDSNIVDNSAKQREKPDESDANVEPAPDAPETESAEDAEENTGAVPDLLSNEDIRIRNFEKLESEVKDLGDGVKIRTHSTSAAKEYTSAYYFYSNKLMLSHYLMLFILMILEIGITFFAVSLGCETPQKNALPFFIAAIVVSLAFPLAAFIMNLINPEKKKRVTFNFRISMIFRTVVMIEALILIYTVNIMMGMPLTFGNEYLVTLLVPAIMTTNIPVSGILFNSLYKGGKYRIEE